MNIEIGKNITQPKGFSAFVLHPFPQEELYHVSKKVLLKITEADRLVGKLDGITHVLPDVDFFLYMFLMKDATASSQIEGTKATIIDALEKDAGIASQNTDADDILYYIKALHYGIKALRKLPLSLRWIKGIHKELMYGARATHFSDPGEFRKSQNYIGGTNLNNAEFIPPPVHEMHKALGDFEKFLHETKMLPLLHIGLAHAHFETIHPFLDGNGRTGRLLISLLFYQKQLLEKPVLFLSSWFKKHQKIYYRKLNDYHKGKVESWILFFLEGVVETTNEAIKISKQIRNLRDRDMAKLQSLAQRESESGVKVLSHLFCRPVITNKEVRDWTQFTRAGAQRVIDRFVSLKILQPIKRDTAYHKAYMYRDYVNAFKESKKNF